MTSTSLYARYDARLSFFSILTKVYFLIQGACIGIATMRRVTQSPYTVEFHWINPDFRDRCIQYYSASTTILGVGMNANRTERVPNQKLRVENSGKAENITTFALDIFDLYTFSLVAQQRN
ncbi:hypothetical protein M434DRAFT_37648 [Hypoxylon sp. CO27-5]|nr:hypothetical protein M434DRAFT_37648 [Hypoxylon sp. CO27-5]